jgi:alpha-1,2-mannosyltransferase
MPAPVHRGLERLRRVAGTSGGLPVRRSVVVGVASVAAIIAVATFARRYGFADLVLHRAAVQSWLSGDGLYAYRSPVSHLGFPLPPVAAVLLTPTAVLPLALAGWLSALTSIAALVVALIVLVGPVARRHARRRTWAVAAAAVLALTAEPVRTTLGLGHLDLLVFGLVVADVVALRRRLHTRRRSVWWPGRTPSSPRAPLRGRLVEATRDVWRNGSWAGVGIGLATAIAAGPILFLAYLAVTRQWRAAATATGTALGATLLTFLVTPKETLAWFTDVLWRIDRTGTTDATGNQSLAGVLARFYDSTTTPVLLWLSFALLLLAVGLIRARAAHADGDEAAAFTLVGVTSLAIGPVTGTYELVWVLPAVLILIDVAARRHAASRLPSGRGLRAARRILSRSGVPGRISTTGLGWAVSGAVVHLMLAVPPIWAFEHRLPATSHYADGIAGMLAENTVGFTLILLTAALPWRPGASPAYHPHPWAPTPTKRRPIPPARRPMP